MSLRGSNRLGSGTVDLCVCVCVCVCVCINNFVVK